MGKISVIQYIGQSLIITRIISRHQISAVGSLWHDELTNEARVYASNPFSSMHVFQVNTHTRRPVVFGCWPFPRVFKAKRSSIRLTPLSFHKKAQLCPAHYYTMSIDFGLQSWTDKMVLGLVLSDYSELQILSAFSPDEHLDGSTR